MSKELNNNDLSDDLPKAVLKDNLPKAIVQEETRFSAIWLVPLIAMIIGGSLLYKTISGRGATITISFKDGSGIEPKKTKLKYRAVDIGTVQRVRLSDDLSRVIVTAILEKGKEHHLKTKTKFWVVRPRVSATQITGMETLISGAYIGMEPGSGTATVRTFVGLDEPPEGASTNLTLSDVAESAAGAFRKISDLPLDELIKNLIIAIQGVNELVQSPELKETVIATKITMEESRKTLNELKNFAQNANSHMELLSLKFEKTLDEAHSTLAQAQKTLSTTEKTFSDDSAFRYEIDNALKEVSRAARSIRTLTDFLARHPNSLITGKKKAGSE